MTTEQEYDLIWDVYESMTERTPNMIRFRRKKSEELSKTISEKSAARYMVEMMRIKLKGIAKIYLREALLVRNTTKVYMKI